MLKINLFIGLLWLTIAVHSAAIKDDEVPMEAATVADILSCQIDTPTRDACIKESLEHILPKLYNGLKAIHVPPLDPLVLDNTPIKFQQGAKGQGIVANGMLKARIGGVRQTQLKTVKSDITKDKFVLDMTAYVPLITIDGSFKGKGSFNMMSLNTKVSFNATLKKNTADVKVMGDFVDRDGERYLKITGFNVKPMNLSDFKLKMNGLFPDETMNIMAMEFINQNWRLVYKDVVEATKVVWEPLFIQLTNQVTNSDIPFRALMHFDNEEVYKITE